MKKKQKFPQEVREDETIEAKADAGPEETGDPSEKEMEEDIALFHELFPDVKGTEIPAEVWERVEAGESLAAAFALYTVQKARREEKIREVNEKNEKAAPPRVRHDGDGAGYFSPEAVKAMTRSEIKKNYDAILRSMESWN